MEIHEYEFPAEEQTCRRCGHALEKIGREYVRRECEYIPTQVKYMDITVPPVPAGAVKKVCQNARTVNEQT